MSGSGPDGAASWAIAACCCFINSMLYGMTRLNGVLFVASVTRYGVGREEASFPYTFANFVRNTSGPLVGYLGHKLGVRSVATFGCLLAAIGVGSCFLAESVGTITVFWGTLYGLGFGLGNILLPVKINQYFDKHRATASGISFSGSCLGSFVLPSVVEVLVDTYGLSGTFLILAGLILNCVPAALLLRNPNFTIKSTKRQSYKDLERQNITSGRKVKLYTVEYGSDLQVKAITEPLKRKFGNLSSVGPIPLTYNQRMKCPSTQQTLMSNDSFRMSSPDLQGSEQILNKERRQMDQTFPVCEIGNVVSYKSDQDSVRSRINKERQQVDQTFPVCEIGSVTSYKSDQDSVRSRINKERRQVDQTFPGCEIDNAVSYKSDQDSELSRDCNSLCEESNSKTVRNPFILKSPSDSSAPLSCNNSFPQSSKDHNHDSTLVTSQNRHAKYGQYINNGYEPDNEKDSRDNKKPPTPESSSMSSIFSIVYDPFFVLIAVTNALYSFTFVCMMTVIVDFARDVGVGETNEKFVLMSLSAGDLVGRLGLGWLTDGGHMTRTGFAALCFLCQGVTTTAIAWSTGFYGLVVLTALYGMSEAGLIVIFPLIIAEFVDQDKQTVAIPSASFLAGPLCLTVAPLIGYFRDEIGSYKYIFYGIGLISAFCSFAWLLTTCIVKFRRSKEISRN